MATVRKLSADRIREREAHAAAVRAALLELNNRIVARNRIVQEADADVDSALDNLNEQIEKAAAWRDEVVEEMRDYADARSDRWRGGESGQAHEAWMAEYDGLSLETLTIRFPDAVDELDEDLPETLEALSDAPDQ